MAWVRFFKSQEDAIKLIPPGTLRRVKFKDDFFCFGHNDAGLFALKDECPHERVALSPGRINHLGEVICPLHAYCFDVKTGDEQTGKNCRAKVYELEKREGGIFLKLDD